MDSGRLREVADDILQATEAGFAAAKIALPERRFVSNNGVAFDCAQLSVEVGALGSGTAVSDRAVSNRMPSVPVATILVALIRDCQPMSDESGTPPTVEAIEAASEELLADASVLMQIFMKRKVLGSCSDVSLQSCVPYGPEGGVAGWVLTIRTVF